MKYIIIPTLNDYSHLSSEKAEMLNSSFVRCFDHALPPLSQESLPDAEVNFLEVPIDLLCTEEKGLHLHWMLPKHVDHQQKCLKRLQPALHLQLRNYSVSPCGG